MRWMTMLDIQRWYWEFRFSNENGTLFSRSLQEAIMKNWFELKIEWGIYMHGLAFAGDR
uniref:Uncharacterized protein n=1 Tax=Nelumbo nucifera TaxID=4432 RepID=A0A822YUW5_NELNU|nr:TPA_asm: hypothetical protein HUJ06_011889 [Nelumbo nucifera]